MEKFTTAAPLTRKPTYINRLFEPVSIGPLVLFRIIFGALLCYHFISAMTNGSVYENFCRPPFNFPFIGFEFLHPFRGNGMYVYFSVMAFLSIMLLAGAWYRFAGISLAIMYSLVYLAQKTGYNNHYYLLLLLLWIMCFVPAGNFFSIDVWRKKLNATTQCMAIYIWIFIFQVSVMYFFAAISKIDSDWFSGKFISIQFSRLALHPYYGKIYGNDFFQHLICYGGFLFDLLVVPLLLLRKTRRPAFVISCLFHLFNAFSFSIGIFPWLSIALNVFFFNPAWIQQRFFGKEKPVARQVLDAPDHSRKNLLRWILGLYIFIQLVLPTRSWFFPGNVFWTEEGYRMSWKMMMRAKSGKVRFKIVDPGSKTVISHDPLLIFTPNQVMWIAISPDMTWQYAQKLKKDYAAMDRPNVQVYAIGAVSLNRSPAKPLVDSTVDLASVKWQPFRHAKWITDF